MRLANLTINLLQNSALNDRGYIQKMHVNKIDIKKRNHSYYFDSLFNPKNIY